MRDIIVFGIGKTGGTVIAALAKQYHILFLTDNDEEKWGDIFEGYTVKPPIEIQHYHCEIIVASTKYGIEIANQLQSMGIGSNRIYLCRGYQKDDGYGCDVYPLGVQKVLEAERTLIQYDLLNTEECQINHTKVLVFCLSKSVYPKQLIQNMSKRYNDIEFSLLTNTKESKADISAEQLKHIYYFETMSDLKTILVQLPVYDVIQLLWIENEWTYFYELIRMKAKKLCLLIGGSDFYRAGKGERDYKKKLICVADSILSVTSSVSKDFLSYYGKELRDKIVMLHYGKEVLDFIKNINNSSVDAIKRKFHVPSEKIVITCGHNADEAHRHMEVIDALNQLPDIVKRKIVCVFPMTYPNSKDTYINEVYGKLEETMLDYVILTEFMDFQAMAEYAVISDIMIHVQTTDLLSSAMLEQMYAGALVIAGSWLPYDSLHEMGIYFLDVDMICDITQMLTDAVMNIKNYRQRCKGNREIVWNNSSWDVMAPRWHQLWDN